MKGADQARFYKIAFGSLRETQAILMLLDLECSLTYEKSDMLAGSIYNLLKCYKAK